MLLLAISDRISYSHIFIHLNLWDRCFWIKCDLAWIWHSINHCLLPYNKAKSQSFRPLNSSNHAINPHSNILREWKSCPFSLQWIRCLIFGSSYDREAYGCHRDCFVLTYLEHYIQDSCKRCFKINGRRICRSLTDSYIKFNDIFCDSYELDGSSIESLV